MNFSFHHSYSQKLIFHLLVRKHTGGGCYLGSRMLMMRASIGRAIICRSATTRDTANHDDGMMRSQHPHVFSSNKEGWNPASRSLFNNFRLSGWKISCGKGWDAKNGGVEGGMESGTFADFLRQRYWQVADIRLYPVGFPPQARGSFGV